MRPGIVSKDQEGKLTCRPIFSRIVSLFAEQNDLQYAVPGGLIGKEKYSAMKKKNLQKLMNIRLLVLYWFNYGKHSDNSVN